MRKLILAASCAMLLSTPAFADEFMNHIDSADIFAGIGIGGYNRDLGSITSSGIGWQVRAGVDAYKYFGAELAYQGANPSVQTFFAPGQTYTGYHATYAEFSADLRGGYPIFIQDHLLKPYAVLGIGFEHILINDALGAVGMGSDTAFAVPLGLGISYNVSGPWAVDARYTYSFLSGGRMDIAPSGDSWQLGVNVGAKFGG